MEAQVNNMGPTQGTIIAFGIVIFCIVVGLIPFLCWVVAEMKKLKEQPTKEEDQDVSI